MTDIVADILKAHEKFQELYGFLNNTDIKIVDNGVDENNNAWKISKDDKELFRSSNFELFVSDKTYTEDFSESTKSINYYITKAYHSLGYLETGKTKDGLPVDVKEKIEEVISILKEIKTLSIDATNDKIFMGLIMNKESLIRVVHKSENESKLNNKIALNPTGLIKAILTSGMLKKGYSETITIQRIKQKKYISDPTQFKEVMFNYYARGNNLKYSRNNMKTLNAVNNLFVDTIDEYNLNLRPLLMCLLWLKESSIDLETEMASVQEAMNNVDSTKTNKLFSRLNTYKIKPKAGDHPKTHLLGSLFAWSVFDDKYGNKLKVVVDPSNDVSLLYWTGDKNIIILDFYYDQLNIQSVGSNAFDVFISKIKETYDKNVSFDFYKKITANYTVNLKELVDFYNDKNIDPYYESTTNLVYSNSQATLTTRNEGIDKLVIPEPLKISNFLK